MRPWGGGGDALCSRRKGENLRERRPGGCVLACCGEQEECSVWRVSVRGGLERGSLPWSCHPLEQDALIPLLCPAGTGAAAARGAGHNAGG